MAKDRVDKKALLLRDEDLAILKFLQADLVARGSEIRQQRTELGLSQEDVANTAGVSQRAVSRSENQVGRQLPEHLAAISAALKMPFSHAAYLETGYLVPDVAIDKAILEILEILLDEERISGVPTIKVEELINDLADEPELRIYRSLDELQRSKLWLLIEARGWLVRDSEGLLTHNQLTIAFTVAFERWILFMTPEFQRFLSLPRTLRKLDSTRIKVNFADLPNVKEVDQVFTDRLNELGRRLDRLQAVAIDAPAQEFIDLWASCDFLIFEGDPTSVELLQYLHRQLKLLYESFQLPNGFSKTKDTRKLGLEMFRHLVFCAIQEVHVQGVAILQGTLDHEAMYKWSGEFRHASKTFASYLTKPILYISIKDEDLPEMNNVFDGLSSNDRFHPSFNELQRALYFSLLPRLRA